MTTKNEKAATVKQGKEGNEFSNPKCFNDFFSACQEKKKKEGGVVMRLTCCCWTAGSVHAGDASGNALLKRVVVPVEATQAGLDQV